MKMATEILTQARLKEVLNYDPLSGLFTRRTKTRGMVEGTLCGCDNGRGYVRIRVDGNYVLAHRLAWLYVYGDWPSGEIDHVNRDTKDNRIANLRVVDRSANLLNRGWDRRNTSGVRNVNWDKSRCKWVAQLRRNGQQINLGRFDSISEAESALRSFLKGA
jgi:hypothetical protein